MSQFSKEEKICFSASLAIFLLFLLCALYFTAEGPETDDPDVVVGAISEYLLANNSKEQFYSLAKQNAEHRMLTTRLYALLSIALFDYISIQFLIALGVVIVYAIALLLYFDNRIKGTARPADLLVYSLLLLTPAFWASTSAAWGTSNFGSIFYTYIAIICLMRNNTTGFWYFELASVLAIFTQTNGWFCLPLGMGILLLNRPSGYRWMLLVHLAIAFVVFKLYFSHYDSYETLRATAIQTALSQPVKAIVNYSLWVGIWLGQWIMPVGAFSKHIQVASTLSFIIGWLMLITTAIYLIRNWKIIFQNNQSQCWLLVFIIASIAIGSLNRSQLAGSHFALSDRYAFYSLCALCVLYSLISSTHRIKIATGHADFQGKTTTGQNHWEQTVPLLAALIYWLSIYSSHYGEIEHHRQLRLKCVEQWNTQKEAKPCYWHSHNGMVMKRAEELGTLRVSRGVLAGSETNKNR